MKQRTTIDETVHTYILAHQKDFYRLAYSYTKNSDDALDVVQEAVYKALLKSSTLKNPEYIKTWMYRIVVNESINVIRKNKKTVLNDDYITNMTHNDKDISGSITLYEAIEALDPMIGTIIKLRFYEDMKLQEIAQITESNLNTTKTRLYKGLELLKERIGDDFID